MRSFNTLNGNRVANQIRVGTSENTQTLQVVVKMVEELRCDLRNMKNGGIHQSKGADYGYSLRRYIESTVSLLDDTRSRSAVMERRTRPVSRWGDESTLTANTDNSDDLDKALDALDAIVEEIKATEVPASAASSTKSTGFAPDPDSQSLKPRRPTVLSSTFVRSANQLYWEIPQPIEAEPIPPDIPRSLSIPGEFPCTRPPSPSSPLPMHSQVILPDTPPPTLPDMDRLPSANSSGNLRHLLP
jgi:hypothetical protein